MDWVEAFYTRKSEWRGSNGVVFDSPPMQQAGGILAVFRDLDGNGFVLAQAIVSHHQADVVDWFVAHRP